MDLLASKIPDIHGAPPLSDSDSLRGKRVFFNGKVDYEGPAHLPNTAKTRIRKQVGGRKPLASKTHHGSDIKDLFDLSPSPAPMQLRSMKQKGVKGSVANVAEETDSLPPIRLPKTTLGRKHVEVIVTKKAGKTMTGEPSVITIQDSTDSNYILEKDGDKHRKLIDSSSDTHLLEGQALYTCKHKANHLDSSHAVKRAASSADKSTKQLSKGMQGSLQARKARFRIYSPLDTNSSGDNEPKTNNPESHEYRMSGTLGHIKDARSAMHTGTHLSEMP